MLVLDIGSTEGFDDASNEFVTIPGTRIELEHSLVSLSKWESLYEKPFLGGEKKSTEEVIAYIKVMTLTSNVPEKVYNDLSDANFDEVNAYIAAKQSATWFNEAPGSAVRNREVITAEIIYYWMIALSIPFECQHWHINRLLTLVKVCNEKNQPPKKMAKQSLAARNRQLNAERKAKMGTSG